MNELFDMLKAQNEAYVRAYNQGTHDGYQKGFKDGIAEANRIWKEALTPEKKSSEAA